MKKIKFGVNKFVQVCKIILIFCVPILVLEFILTYGPGDFSMFKNEVALATTVKPETFTELYFNNHLGLPNKVELNKNYTFSFTIHNQENQDVHYMYEVYVDKNGSREYLDRGTVQIKNNGYKAISENFVAEVPIGKSKVTVNLIANNQVIDFWIGGNE